MRRIVALSVFFLLLSACAGRAGSSTHSGVRGIVLLGPTCPVESLESPCPDRPLAGVRVEAQSDGDVIASATSGNDGRFELPLPPGRYVLQAMLKPGGPGMFARPVDVQVSGNTWVDVTVPVDSGIRTPGYRP